MTSPFDRLYGRPLALLTDLYQVTMALGHFRRPDADLEAAYHLFFPTPRSAAASRWRAAWRAR